MSRTTSIIRQHDLTRALRAARAAGLAVSGFEVDAVTGKITVNTASAESKQRRAGDGGDTPEGVKALL